LDQTVNKKTFSEFNIFSLFLSVILICYCLSIIFKLGHNLVTIMSLIQLANHEQVNVLRLKGVLELETIRTV